MDILKLPDSQRIEDMFDFLNKKGLTNQLITEEFKSINDEVAKILNLNDCIKVHENLCLQRSVVRLNVKNQVLTNNYGTQFYIGAYKLDKKFLDSIRITFSRQIKPKSIEIKIKLYLAELI